MSRIRTIGDAKRCVRAIITYLRRHENPMAAQDLADAVKLIEQKAKEETS